ncbi:MAG: hypothetical protein N4A39_11700, partial [Roseicyclus sp.]|nr:hypothetical protein [Roseicyclus sp.]
VPLADATTAGPSFTAPGLLAGDAAVTLTFELVVTDSLGLASVADAVTITVTAPPMPEGAEVVVDVSGAEALPADASSEAEITVILKNGDGTRHTRGGVRVMASTSHGILRQNPEGSSIPMRDNGDGSYSAWLRAAEPGIATVRITVEEEVLGSVRVAFAATAIPDTVARTEGRIAGFLLGRVNQLVSNQPRLTRFLHGEGCGSLNARITGPSGSVDGCVAHGALWSEVTATWGRETTYALGTIGAHRFINDNVLLGAMVQFDHAVDGVNDAAGRGWMAGPYFAAKLDGQPLHVSGRLLYGQTRNTITPIDSYSDTFTTVRWLADFELQGEIETPRVIWSPSLGLTHATDTQQAYTDSLGQRIGAQTVSLTQVTGGLDFLVPWTVSRGDMQMTGGLAALYSATAGGETDFDGLRGRVHLGLDWQSGTGSTVQLGAFHDGLGTDYSAFGANLAVEIRF